MLCKRQMSSEHSSDTDDLLVVLKKFCTMGMGMGMQTRTVGMGKQPAGHWRLTLWGWRQEQRSRMGLGGQVRLRAAL